MALRSDFDFRRASHTRLELLGIHAQTEAGLKWAYLQAIKQLGAASLRGLFDDQPVGGWLFESVSKTGFLRAGQGRFSELFSIERLQPQICVARRAQAAG